MKMKLPCHDSLVIIGYYGENIVDISYCASLGEKIKICGGNWDLNDRPQSSKPAIAIHSLIGIKSIN